MSSTVLFATMVTEAEQLRHANGGWRGYSILKRWDDEALNTTKKQNDDGGGSSNSNEKTNKSHYCLRHATLGQDEGERSSRAPPTRLRQ